MDHDTWKCTPPAEYACTDRETYDALMERIGGDGWTLVMGPVRIDEWGASVPAWAIEDDGEVTGHEVVAVTYDEMADDAEARLGWGDE